MRCRELKREERDSRECDPYYIHTNIYITQIQPIPNDMAIGINTLSPEK